MCNLTVEVFLWCVVGLSEKVSWEESLPFQSVCKVLYYIVLIFLIFRIEIVFWNTELCKNLVNLVICKVLVIGKPTMMLITSLLRSDH